MNKDEIKALRMELGLSQEKMARIVNVGMQTYQHWERGKRKPHPLCIEKLYEVKARHEQSKLDDSRQP